MNIANLDKTALKHHSRTINNIRQAAKNFSERLGEHFPIGISIETSGQTISTGSIEGVCIHYKYEKNFFFYKNKFIQTFVWL